MADDNTKPAACFLKGCRFFASGGALAGCEPFVAWDSVVLGPGYMITPESACTSEADEYIVDGFFGVANDGQ